MSGAAERNGGPAPGAERVAVALSGGVDSSVAAALLVEHTLGLRLNEHNVFKSAKMPFKSKASWLLKGN